MTAAIFLAACMMAFTGWVALGALRTVSHLEDELAEARAQLAPFKRKRARDAKGHYLPDAKVSA